MAAGSVAAAILLGATGFHFGCKGGTGDISSVTNALSGTIGVGGGGGGGGSNPLGQVGQGLSAVQKVGQGFQDAVMTSAREDAMGQSVAVAVTNQYELTDDEALNEYVTKVGMALVNVSPRPVGNWHFGVLESNEVNAFAGPNGYIFVTTGALDRMDDEAELAGVLGHEITHVLHHHGLEAVRASGQAGIASGISQGVAAFNSDWAQFAGVFDAGVDLVLTKPYGRTQEIDSDKNAVALMVAAGYDPQSYLRFLRKLEGGGLFSTHPGSAERTASVNRQIQALGARGGATLRERFEKNVRDRA